MNKHFYMIVLLLLVCNITGCNQPTNGLVLGKKVESRYLEGKPSFDKDNIKWRYQLRISNEWYDVTKEEYNRFKLGDRYPWPETVEEE